MTLQNPVIVVMPGLAQTAAVTAQVDLRWVVAVVVVVVQPRVVVGIVVLSELVQAAATTAQVDLR